MDQSWFEMADVTTKNRMDGVWVPLYCQQMLRCDGEREQIGRVEDFLGISTLAVPKRFMTQDLKIECSSLLGKEFGPVIQGDRYTPTGLTRRSFGTPCGVSLVLFQRIPGEDHRLLHLDQDLVFALGLKREENTWIRPAEDYREAVRVQVDSDGHPVLVEIRQEFLKDYLCARNMGLCMVSYQERVEIRQDFSEIAWVSGSAKKSLVDGKWCGHVMPLDATGMPVGSVSVLHITRPGADPKEDVPKVSHTDQMKTEHSTFTRETASYRIDGRTWRTEWLDPGTTSPRVRGDHELPVSFLIDATGAQETSVNLASSGRWIWFRSDVIPALTNRRGGDLEWRTREIGRVSCSPDCKVTFGLNQIGLVTVYAKDIAYLPQWQQRLWAGFNVSPEGGLSEEMHRSQVVGEPSDTYAPEMLFAMAIDWVEEMFHRKLGRKLFLDHDTKPECLKTISRFSGCDWPGLLKLAKNITRLIADSLNKEVLKSLIENPGDLGSLKLLEKYLSTMISEPEAKEMMSPLFCAYDLRMGDAHLPKSNLEIRLSDMGVNRNQPYVWQSAHMLHICANALGKIGNVFAEN